MADARLVIAVVRSPEGDERAQQERLLVAVLGGAHEIGGVRARLLADGEQLLRDPVDRLVPRDALVLAVHQLHRVFQAARIVRHAVVAHGSALRAVRTEVDRRVEHWLLPHPYAVLHHRVDRAADRAVGADRSLYLDLALARDRLGLRLADHAEP